MHGSPYHRRRRASAGRRRRALLRGIAQAAQKPKPKQTERSPKNVSAAEARGVSCSICEPLREFVSLTKPCQLPRKEVVATGKGFGPTGFGLVALTIGSRRSKSAGVRREAEEDWAAEAIALRNKFFGGRVRIR